MKKATLALTVALLGPACGGTTPEPRNPDMTPGEAAASTVVLVVRNNLIPVSTVRVSVHRLGSGQQTVLGNVQANETATFAIEARDVVGGFWIRAEGLPGAVLLSREINETGGWRHTWNMGANIVLSERSPGTF